MRRISVCAISAVIVLAACGGSDSASTTEPVEADTTDAAAETVETAGTDAPAATEAPTTTAAPPDTQAPAETDVAETAEGTSDGAVGVSLVEWAIDVPTSIAPGMVSFDVTNDGNFPHHLAIARGDSYETLPQLANGAIDEASLGADFIGRTDNVPSGGGTTADFELEAGNYVFFCNIVAGPNSHAAQGQTLSVVVG